MKNKLTAIGVIACLGFFILQVTTPAFFVAGLQLVKISQRNFIESHTVSSNEFLTLTFDKGQFAELTNDNADEFSYQGKMYDIHSVRTSGNRVFVTVLPDNFEDLLVKLNQHALAGKSKRMLSVIKVLLSYTWFCESIKIFSCFVMVSVIGIGICSGKFLTSWFNELNSPPPEICFQ